MSQMKLMFPPFLAPTHWLPSLAGFLWTPDVSEEPGSKPTLPLASRDAWQSSAHLSIPPLTWRQDGIHLGGIVAGGTLHGWGFRKHTVKAAW